MLVKPTPKVSVVMSVYNGEQFLHEAVDSIIAQTYQDFELILVDDASTDSSPSIIESYQDPRIIHLTNETNLGLTRSLNIGLLAAKGEFIARQDADDTSDPKRLQRQVDFLSNHTQVGLVGTRGLIIDTSGRALELLQFPTSDVEIQDLLTRQNCFLHGSVMFRRDCIENVGLYREQFTFSQDYDLWLRIAEKYSLANLDSILYNYRFDGKAISQTRANAQLAYLELAKELAHQRRTQGKEQDIPKDVTEAFAPKHSQLLHNTRRRAYLYYIAGDLDEASIVIAQAQQLILHQTENLLSWDVWAKNMAHELDAKYNNPIPAVNFIKWLFSTLSLPDSDRLSKITIGQLYADKAFDAYEKKTGYIVIHYAYQAFRYDYSKLFNRGLWVISLKSILPGQDIRVSLL